MISFVSTREDLIFGYYISFVNLSLIVFCDVTSRKIMSLDVFCEVARVSVKVIKINNSIVVNSFFIFRVNLQFSVRVQIYTLL